MKDLEDFARAKKAGHEFEYMFARKWQPLEVPIALDVLVGRLATGSIRVKPNKTYYRVCLDQVSSAGGVVTLKSDKPFNGLHGETHDFEIEETPAVPTITLYEHTTDSGGTRWLKVQACKSETGRTITGVINGEGDIS